MPRITADDLIEHGAHCGQVDRFRELRPNGVRWTTQRGLQRIADQMAREGLDVWWAAIVFGLTVVSRLYYPDGTIEVEHHYRDGLLHDPDPETPADRRYYPDGTVSGEVHYRDGLFHDPDPDTPAVRHYYPDGTVELEAHCCDGELLTKDSEGGKK